jgi:hypothetical protein
MAVGAGLGGRVGVIVFSGLEVGVNLGVAFPASKTHAAWGVGGVLDIMGAMAVSTKRRIYCATLSHGGVDGIGREYIGMAVATALIELDFHVPSTCIG